VDAWRVRNVAFDSVGVGIHDYDVGAVRDVNARASLRRKRSPSLRRGKRKQLDDVIAGSAGLGSGAGKYCGGKKSDGGKCSEA